MTALVVKAATMTELSIAQAVPDQNVRDAAINSVHPITLVEAPAGSGKTSLLVERIVALLRGLGTTGEQATGVFVPAPPRSIAAITFTSAAAAELRRRVRQRALDDPALRAVNIDELTITTLHGFAGQLLSQHALDAGLPPGWTQLDELESRADERAQVRRLADGLFSDGDEPEPWVMRALALGLKRTHLAALINKITVSGAPLTSDWRPPVRPLTELDITDVLAATRRVADLLAQAWKQGISDDDKLAAAAVKVQHWAITLAGQRSEAGQLVALGGPLPGPGGKGKAADWGPLKPELVAAITDVHDRRTALLDVLGEELADLAAAHGLDELADAIGRRQQAGTLSFDDLIRQANRLLLDCREVRTTLAQRFRHLLVDEFQDTDPQQLSIVTALAADPDVELAPHWAQRLLRPAALTVVGDPRQAIYRFRQADIRLYNEVTATWPAEGQFRLLTNFRSAQPLVEAVNALSGALLAESGASPPRAIGIRPERHHGPHVIVRGLEETDAPDMAGDVAQLIGQLLQQRIAVGPPGDQRALRAADIAVLLRNRTRVPALMAACEDAGVPVRREGRVAVLREPEADEVLRVMRAIDQPGNRLAVVGALRSTVLGCSDADLVDWARATGADWSVLAAVPDGLSERATRVGAALAWLGTMVARSTLMTPSEVVAAAIERGDLRRLVAVRRGASDGSLVLHARAAERWRRLDALCDVVREIEAGGASTLGLAMAELADRIDDRVHHHGVAGDLDDDAVSIMTVHAAKGLEFPVVIVADLDSQTRGGTRAAWVDERLLVQIGAKANGLRHRALDEAIEDDKAEELAEAQRLAYVAVTRAVDLLVLALHRPMRASKTAKVRWSDRLANAVFQLDPSQWSPVLPDSWPRFDASQDAHKAANRDDDARGFVLREVKPALIAKPATSLAKHGPGEAATFMGLAADAPALDVDASPRWSGRRDGTAIGRAVHAVLEHLGSSRNPELLAALVAASCEREGVAASRDEVTKLVRSVQRAPVLAEADSGRAWRELPLSVVEHGVLIEGVIDLLIERSDGSLVVVDYKTDQVRTEAEADEKLARYALQGGAYALMVERHLGRIPAEVVFIFARAPEVALERRTTEVADLIADVRCALAATAAIQP
jgi:ATP-dependent helicase/nuclease subunit A